MYVYVCRKCNSTSKTETLNNVPGSSRLMSAAVRNNDRAASQSARWFAEPPHCLLWPRLERLLGPDQHFVVQITLKWSKNIKQHSS